MRASEALRMGSKMIAPLRGQLLNAEHTAGCALGMISIGNQNFSLLTHCYPWTLLRAEFPCSCCSCRDELVMGSGGMLVTRNTARSNIQEMVVHLFNYHVCTTHDWTIDQIADWLDTVDPTYERGAQMQDGKALSTIQEPPAPKPLDQIEEPEEELVEV